jgi:multicomponent Na+:H+ antiporter subunit F
MNTFLSFCLMCSGLLLASAIFFTVIRIVKGPTTANRVVCLDLLNSISVGAVALLSIWRGQSLYLDVILGFVLVIFLGTVAYAQYIGAKKKE